MKKKIIGLGACFCLLVALAVVYGALSSNKPEDVEEEETGYTTYTVVEGDEANAVKLLLKSAEYDIELTKDSDGVWGSAELNLPLNQSSIATLLSYSARLATVYKVTDEAENMAEYGLDNPQVTVTAVFEDGTEHTILLGNQTPDKSYYYVTAPGDSTVYMVTTYVGGVLSRNYKDFIDTTIPEIDVYNLRYIYFDNGNEPLEAVYNPEGVNTDLYYASDMIMTSPLEGKSVYIESFTSMVVEPVSAITLVETVEMFPQNLSEYGLDNPRVEVIIEGLTVDEESNYSEYRYYLAVGNNDETGEYAYVMLCDLPCVFKVANTDLEALYNGNSYNAIDKYIVMVGITTVESLTLDLGDIVYDLQVNNFKDYTESEEGKDAIAPTIDGRTVGDSVFRSLYTLYITMPIDAVIDAYTPESEPALSISFNLLNGKTMKTYFYDYSDNFYAIMQEGEEIHFVINKTAIDRIIKNTKGVKSGNDAIEA